MSEHWVQKWGDHGWAFRDPTGQEATLGVYQRKGEWRSVVQARAGLDTEDIAARVIAKLANRVAELEAAVRWVKDKEKRRWAPSGDYEYSFVEFAPHLWELAHPVVRSLVERKEEW